MSGPQGDAEPACSARWRRKEELERERTFEAERKGDVWGPEGSYWRRRKPSLDELDAHPVELADEPPPGWGCP